MAIVCLNEVLLCVCFRPVKYPPYCTARRTITLITFWRGAGAHTSEQKAAATIDTLLLGVLYMFKVLGGFIGRLGPYGMPVMIRRAAVMAAYKESIIKWL